MTDETGTDACCGLQLFKKIQKKMPRLKAGVESPKNRLAGERETTHPTAAARPTRLKIGPVATIVSISTVAAIAEPAMPRSCAMQRIAKTAEMMDFMNR